MSSNILDISLEVCEYLLGSYEFTVSTKIWSLLLLLHTLEVLDSDLDLQDSCLDWGFCGFPQTY
jgi:hypothetical protein